MATVAASYTPQWWAATSLAQLFDITQLPLLIHRDFDNVVASKGDTVTTRIPQRLTATDVVVGTPLTTSELTPTKVDTKLDQFIEVSFKVNDKDWSMGVGNVIQDHMIPAMQGLALRIENDIFKLYKDVSNNIGTAGTTPSGIDKLCTDVRQRMTEALIPPAPRHFVMSAAASNKWQQLFFSNATVAAERLQIQGFLDQRYGINYFESTLSPTHTPGTGEAGTVTGVQASGSTTLTGGSMGISKTWLKGDLFTIATGPAAGQYVVTADHTTTAGEVGVLAIDPPLRGATAGGEVISAPTAAHVINLAFDPGAFSLVNRPLGTPNAPGAQVAVAVFNGFSIRASTWYEPREKETYIDLDCLYGVKTLDARRAVRVLG